MGFFYVNTKTLYHQAVLAYRSIPGPTDTRPLRRNALTSIVFAAITLEAFINDLAAHVASIAAEQDAPAWAVTLRQILQEAEQSRTSVQSKYLLTRFVLTGNSFDKSDSAYQEFDRLMRLRNEIVHAKPQESTHHYEDGQLVNLQEPPIIGILRSTRGLANFDTLFGPLNKGWEGTSTEVTVNLLEQISTKWLARWACNAAAAMVATMIDSLPDPTASQLRFSCRLEQVE